MTVIIHYIIVTKYNNKKEYEPAKRCQIERIDRFCIHHSAETIFFQPQTVKLHHHWPSAHLQMAIENLHLLLRKVIRQCYCATELGALYRIATERHSKPGQTASFHNILFMYFHLAEGKTI